jgi:hypothetical protein
LLTLPFIEEDTRSHSGFRGFTHFDLTFREARLFLVNLFKCDLSSGINWAILLCLCRSQNFHLSLSFNNIHHVNWEPIMFWGNGLPSNFILLSNFRWPSWIAFWILTLRPYIHWWNENYCHETHSTSYLSLHQAEA